MSGKSEFDKFSEATKRIMGVSKEELKKREEDWKQQKEKERKAKKRGVSRVSDVQTSKES